MQQIPLGLHFYKRDRQGVREEGEREKEKERGRAAEREEKGRFPYMLVFCLMENIDNITNVSATG